jgi:Zn-dependent peptidase ImmA (M78 family)/DNA-binding XRE family transcriptional regulator
MIGQRLRQLRLSRNLTLEALAAEMGGIVTKQALFKYEHDQAQPSPIVLSKLAAALGVKSTHLFSRPMLRTEFIAYRKGSALTKKNENMVKALVEQALEDRIHVQELLGQSNSFMLPIKQLQVQQIEDTETAAVDLRNRWKLGFDPITNVTITLEDHLLCVLDVEASEKFDGISAITYDEENRLRAAAIVTRRGTPGERQRLNLTHELGHLVLNVSDDIDEEKAAFRFGAAFLAPAEKLLQEVGPKRSLIQPEELLLLKKKFGISIQALLYRLRDLAIITESYYRQWCININRIGWKKREPLELQNEEAQWLRRNVLRLIAEGLISSADAERILKKKLELEQPASIVERRAFLKLPLEKRRQILAEQAKKMAKYYEQNSEWRDIEGSDVIEF